MANRELIAIGWRELVGLPDLGLVEIRAKADTGARSSAIDVDEIEELEGDRVRFQVVADRREGGQRRTVEAQIQRRTRVRSSFGRSHDRLFVNMRVAVAGQILETEVGLVSRHNMICRMLLGRKTLLQGPFAVDSGRAYIHGRRKRVVKTKTKAKAKTKAET